MAQYKVEQLVSPPKLITYRIHLYIIIKSVCEVADHALLRNKCIHPSHRIIDNGHTAIIETLVALN